MIFHRCWRTFFFICRLFNDACQQLRLYSVEWNDDRWMMNWKGCGMKWPWSNLKYYPGICLEGLRKTAKNLSLDSLSLGRDMRPGPPEYDAGVLHTQLWRSVSFLLLSLSLKSSTTMLFSNEIQFTFYDLIFKQAIYFRIHESSFEICLSS
jgi:hypothetical protein